MAIRHQPVTRRPITPRTYRGLLGARDRLLPVGACSHGEPSSQVRGDDRRYGHTAVFVSDLRHSSTCPTTYRRRPGGWPSISACSCAPRPRVTLASGGSVRSGTGAGWSTALPWTCGRVAHRRAAIGRVAVHLMRRRGRDQRLGALTIRPTRHTTDFARRSDDVELVIDDQSPPPSATSYSSTPANGCSGRAVPNAASSSRTARMTSTS